jgi:hypothetical protein
MYIYIENQTLLVGVAVNFTRQGPHGCLLGVLALRGHLEWWWWWWWWRVATKLATAKQQSIRLGI